MSDTPRTDKAVFSDNKGRVDLVTGQFARKLERELAESRRLKADVVEAHRVLSEWQEDCYWSTAERTIWAAWKRLDAALHRAALTEKPK